MRQFPQSLATPQDVDNILNNHPEYCTRLKEHLQRAYDEPDDADIVTSYDIDPDTNEMINIVTKRVKKDKMKYKDIGFINKTSLKNTIDGL